MRPPSALPVGAALFIDVDGTLLEIAPRPEAVQVPHPLPALLDRLALQSGGALALVSGRRLDDMDRLFHPWRGAAAGLHGAERRRADGSVAACGGSPDDMAAAATLDRLRPACRALAQAVPGAWVEDKGGTLALHYRAAPQRETEIRDAVEQLLRETDGTLRLIAGKMVVELQPSHHGKGGAIAAFLAEPPFLGRVPVFLGDDVTDEDGFAEVNRQGGVSIRVGPQGTATAARYRLPSVAAARAWLASGTEKRGRRCQP